MSDLNWKPLTAAQEGIWYAQSVDPENPDQNLVDYLDIRGPLRLALLEKAFHQVMAETESARLRFREDGAGPWQAVEPLRHHRLPVVDLRGEPEPSAAAEAWMRADAAHAVDLRNEPVSIVITALLVGEDRTLLYLRTHHITLDFLGYARWLDRLTEIYTALEDGQEPPSTPFASLGEVIADDASYRASEHFRRDQAYWAGQMAAAPEAVTLTGRTAPASHSTHRRTGVPPSGITQSLRTLARTSGVALPALLIGAVGIYLHRMANPPRSPWASTSRHAGVPGPGRGGDDGQRTAAALTSCAGHDRTGCGPGGVRTDPGRSAARALPLRGPLPRSEAQRHGQAHLRPLGQLLPQ